MYVLAEAIYTLAAALLAIAGLIGLAWSITRRIAVAGQPEPEGNTPPYGPPVAPELHCAYCCAHREEPVFPGSFGDYHESCILESLEMDEKLRRMA